MCDKNFLSMRMLPKQMTNVLFSSAFEFQFQLDFRKENIYYIFLLSFLMYKNVNYGYTEGLFLVM